MIRKKTLKSIFIFTLILPITVACCKNESKQERIEKNLTTGTWEITNFIYQGDDQTSSVASYNITLGTEGNLTADNGSATYFGTWNLNYDETNAENQTLHLSILQSPANVFENFNRDWKFIGQTSSKIKLKNENAFTDYLTLENGE